MLTFTEKLAITLREDTASKERILQSLLQKLAEIKRMDKELVQKLELNFEAMKEVEEEIREFEQPALKEQTINFTRERERLGPPQDKRLHYHGSLLEPSQVGMGSPSDSCRSEDLSNCHTMLDEEGMTRAAKRKRLSSPAGPRQMQHDLQEFPSLLTLRSPSISICALVPPKEYRVIDDRFSSMPREEPVVIQSCFRLWPYGPYAFQGYQYAAIIKTDPNQRSLSGDQIAELIQGMGYAWEICDINTSILSPGWTRVHGNVWGPSVRNTDSSTNSSDGDSDPSSGDGDLSEAEEDHECHAN